MIDFRDLYRNFQSPISVIDCGNKCAPHNERGVPFCCDIYQAVPAAYLAEWAFLKDNTDLWRPWEPENAEMTKFWVEQTPPGQILLVCQGHLKCQREFRSITCRSFPFFPYLTLQGDFIGLSYYWEFEDRCWVISNLSVVSQQYRSEFFQVYDYLFEQMPEEKETFRYHSIMMRRIFGRKHKAIPLLHRNGKNYKITPRNGRMRPFSIEKCAKFGPYRIIADLPFPDELLENQFN